MNSNDYLQKNVKNIIIRKEGVNLFIFKEEKVR